jgi:signal transduction histidine kinase
VTKVPVRDEAGNVTGLIGINRDITERKIAAEKAHELALEQERVNILSDFVTDVLHEFRTVASVINTSAYLLTRVTHPEKRQQHISRIVYHVDNFLKLVESMLTMLQLDRLQNIRLQKTSFAEILRLLIDNHHEIIENKHLRLEIQSEISIQTMFADKELLYKALIQILDNAIQFTPEGGTITLDTEINEKEMVISIRDSGVGMPDTIQRNIFKRFYRADVAHTTSGFGLGLPIAQRIVELHHGCIEVESAPEKGSLFRIILPLTHHGE